jgi:ParB family chromosome partitioning protein
MTTTISAGLEHKVESLAALVKSRPADVHEKILSVPIGDIQPGKHQPRTFTQETNDRLTGLAQTIKKDGITDPLIVRQVPSGGYELISGERRWRAARIAGLAKVPVVVREYADEASAKRNALIANLQREDLSLADEIRSVGEMMADLGSVRKVAAEIGKSEQWVSLRHRLADAPSFVKERIEADRNADAEALIELTRLAEKDEPAAKRLLETHEPGSSLRRHLRNGASTGNKKTTPTVSSKAERAKATPTKVVSVHLDGLTATLKTASGRTEVYAFTPAALRDLRSTLLHSADSTGHQRAGRAGEGGSKGRSRSKSPPAGGKR